MSPTIQTVVATAGVGQEGTFIEEITRPHSVAICTVTVYYNYVIILSAAPALWCS